MAIDNQLTLIGNLGQDPKQGKARNGTPYISFSIAEDGSKKLDDKGKPVKKTRWHQCIGWGAKRVQLLSTVAKGDRICVRGVLDYDEKDVDGTVYKFHKLVIEDFKYLDPKSVY